MKQWQMIAASVPGMSHRSRGLPCQDAYRVDELARGGMVAAVADGLGSARWSDRGAQAAVDAAITTLGTTLRRALPKSERAWLDVMQNAFAAARTTLVTLAATEDRPLADYATTLIVTVVTDRWLAIGQVGDGAVVVQPAQKEVCTMSAPQRGEFANETLPITNRDALANVTYCCQPQGPQALALFSDGVQQICLNTADYAPHQPFFAPLFAQLCRPFNRLEAEGELICFLQSERLSKRSDDDKTLVLIGRVQKTVDGRQ